MRKREYGSFGPELRRLRKAQGMSLRAVAEHLGVGFTYLCKIELGTMAPPSESVIDAAAVLLNGDADELKRLAGKLASDLEAYILSRSELVRELRRMQEVEQEGIREFRGILAELEHFRKAAM